MKNVLHTLPVGVRPALAQVSRRVPENCPENSPAQFAPNLSPAQFAALVSEIRPWLPLRFRCALCGKTRVSHSTLRLLRLFCLLCGKKFTFQHA